MADTYNKKEREKKKRKRKQDKRDKKLQKKLDGNKQPEFMYLDENGNLTTSPPDNTKKKKEAKLEDIQISTPSAADLPEEDPMKKGIVKFFNAEKRFGFIKEASTGADFFVHEEKLNDTIREGDKVSFEIDHGPKGLVAVNVSLEKA